MNLESLEACKNEAGPTSLGYLPLGTFSLGTAYLEPRQLSLLSIAAALKNWSKPAGPAASRMACKEQISYEAEDDKLQEFLKNEDASNWCLAPSASSFRQLNVFSSSSHSRVSHVPGHQERREREVGAAGTLGKAWFKEGGGKGGDKRELGHLATILGPGL